MEDAIVYALPAARPRISLKRRVHFYCAGWLCAAVALQIFLQPEGLTVTDQGPLQQRLLWLAFTPLMAIFGLAQALTGPVTPSLPMFLLAAACLLTHGFFMIRSADRGRFTVLGGAQIILLTIAVIYFVRQSQLAGDC